MSEYKYRQAKNEILLDRPMVCESCGRGQGGDIHLSFSHLISRADCNRYGRPELIYDPGNIRLHCMGGCHEKWELGDTDGDDFKENIEYIRRNATGELLNKMLNRFSLL